MRSRSAYQVYAEDGRTGEVAVAGGRTGEGTGSKVGEGIIFLIGRTHVDVYTSKCSQSLISSVTLQNPVRQAVGRVKRSGRST